MHRPKEGPGEERTTLDKGKKNLTAVLTEKNLHKLSIQNTTTSPKYSLKAL